MEEGVSVIADSVVKVFTFASEAVDRCLKLTEGWGLTALIKAIKEVHNIIVMIRIPLKECLCNLCSLSS